MIKSEPPTGKLAALDRRSLLKSGAIGLGLASAPLAARSGARGFSHGIASGEPGPDRVLLWTRYASPDSRTLRYEVAESLDFTRVAAGGEIEASPERDGCAKPWATGLEPGKWYYYRFIAPDGAMSEVGRTRTLPTGAADRFRMAVFSCSNLGFGWFNAYAHAAEADEFDLAVHLGDYYYEYPSGTYPAGNELHPARVIQPPHETVALADYRMRHAAYRADPDLRRLTQLYPMIFVWDDHETANDSWRGGAENHQPESEGPWEVRKAAALRAYREWLPVSDDPWARYDIGDLATIFRLDTRLAARDRQLDVADALRVAEPGKAMAALAAFKAGAWADPSRELLGADQHRWLAQGLADSVRAGRKWQVLAQQVIMGSLKLPRGLSEGLSADAPDYVKTRLRAAEAASAAGLPFSMDAWDGYPAARERLLEAARTADANLVVLAGDSHNAWASELAGAGVEFAGHSVTSPGAEAYLGWKTPVDLARDLVEGNEQLVWADTSRRGYLALELTPARATGEWRFLESVRQKSTVLAGSHRLTAAHGAREFAL